MDNKKYKVCAEMSNGEIQYAWGFDKETAKEVAKQQGSRRIYKRVWIEPDTPQAL